MLLQVLFSGHMFVIMLWLLATSEEVQLRLLLPLWLLCIFTASMLLCGKISHDINIGIAVSSHFILAWTTEVQSRATVASLDGDGDGGNSREGTLVGLCQ